MTYKNLFNNFKLLITFLFIFSSFIFFFYLSSNEPVGAQGSCQDINSGFGTADYSLSDVQSGTHRLWMRVKSNDAVATLKYSISGGGQLCDRTVSTSGATNWRWVQSNDSFTTSGGNVSLKIAGTKAGVGLDCFVLTSDTSFTPSGIDGCTGPQSDTTPPSLSFISPANNASVSGNITISANSSDAESGIQNVVFGVTGRGDLSITDSQPPYERSLNTSSITNGQIQLTITATNGDGLTTTQTRNITINNITPPPPDTTKPTVSITSPAQNANFNGGNVIVSVNSSDNVAVTKVELYLDGQLQLTDTSSPYAFSVSSLSNGTNSIYARAYDPSNNMTQSSTITFKYSTFLAGDVNEDGRISTADVSIIIANYGRSGVSRNQGDLSGDGRVSTADVSILIANFK